RSTRPALVPLRLARLHGGLPRHRRLRTALRCSPPPRVSNATQSPNSPPCPLVAASQLATPQLAYANAAAQAPPGHSTPAPESTRFETRDRLAPHGGVPRL